MGYYYNRTRVVQSASAVDGRVLVFPPKQITKLDQADAAVGGVRTLVERGILAPMAPPKEPAPSQVAGPSPEPEPSPAPVPAVVPMPEPVKPAPGSGRIRGHGSRNE